MDSHPNIFPISSESAQRLLSDRQLECLAWAQEGKSAGDIGQIIGISGRTVEGHLAKACEALGVRTRVQAVIRARELGLLRGRSARHPPPPTGRSFRGGSR
jgi:DNA-binding CsgD family transcriptional regulator